MTPRRIFLASAALLCLLVAACGDSKGTTSTGSPSNNNGNSSATTAASGSSDNGNTTTVTFKGSSNSSFCGYAKGIESSKSLENAFSGTQDAKSTKDSFNQALDLMNTAVSKAPSEIKADLQTLQSGIKKIADLYAKYDYDPAKLGAAAQKDPTVLTQLESLNTADFEAATTRVEAYLSQVCGVTSSS